MAPFRFRAPRLAALLFLFWLPLQSAAQAPTAQAPAAPASATEPTPPRTETRHASFLERAAQGNIDLLWVGDSITDWWARAGIDVWNANFASLNSANFGIAGDTTNGVLWRMRNGELQGFQAKLIILMLGTNNLRRHTPADIAEGDRLIVEEFRRQQPQAKVLVLGVFPRSADPANPARAQIRELNGYLAGLADGENVFFMDIGDRFLAPDGTISEEVMPDGLHPSAVGYQIWADAIGGRVRELLGAP
jgi:lysophospholipase L1-like esterase